MSCPHYQEESERRPSLHEILNKSALMFCWAIDGGAAIHFKGGKYIKSLSFCLLLIIMILEFFIKSSVAFGLKL